MDTLDLSKLSQVLRAAKLKCFAELDLPGGAHSAKTLMAYLATGSKSSSGGKSGSKPGVETMLTHYAADELASYVNYHWTWSSTNIGRGVMEQLGRAVTGRPEQDRLVLAFLLLLSIAAEGHQGLVSKTPALSRRSLAAMQKAWPEATAQSFVEALEAFKKDPTSLSDLFLWSKTDEGFSFWADGMRGAPKAVQKQLQSYVTALSPVIKEPVNLEEQFAEVFQFLCDPEHVSSPWFQEVWGRVSAVRLERAETPVPENPFVRLRGRPLAGEFDAAELGLL